jgi:hypothetical protein
MSGAPAAAQNAAIGQTYRLLLTHVVDFSKIVGHAELRWFSVGRSIVGRTYNGSD